MWNNLLACLLCVLLSSSDAMNFTCKISVNASSNGTQDHEIHNKTSPCLIGPDHEYAFCAAFWRNESGMITLIQKDCFSGNGRECRNRTQCISDGEDQRGIHKCCCTRNLCNAEFFYVPRNDSKDVVKKSPSPENANLMLLLYTLVPIVVICIIVILVYWWNQKRKSKFSSSTELSAVGAFGTEETVSSVSGYLTTGQSDLPVPQLIKQLARGRFGTVWKAKQHDRLVAVKTFCFHEKQSWLNEQEFFNTDLVRDHPNILRYIATLSRGVEPEIQFWLVTEYHEHGSMFDYLKAYTIPITDALRFMESITKGLAFLHKDISYSTKAGTKGFKPAIAHRDFKSKNILITNQKTAVIADFGLAVKFVQGEDLGENHGQVGTRRYMAPEILQGAINFQRDAFLFIDIYAFALVLWEITSRCNDAPGGAAPVHYMPYEEELGQHPTLEQMQDYVVDKKRRPKMQREWQDSLVIGEICETIVECWDQDVEARLSAACVEQRLEKLKKNFISPPPPPAAGGPNLPDVADPSFLDNPPDNDDVELQNMINSQRDDVAHPQCNEDERLLSAERTSPANDLQGSGGSCSYFSV